MSAKVSKDQTKEVVDQKPTEKPIPDVDISAANVAVEQAMMELIYNEPFFANLTLNMRREFTTKFPTLAVSVTDEVNLHINPYFFCNLTIPERVEILKHECLHVVNNHFVRFRDLEPQIYDKPEERGFAERLEDMTNCSTLNKAADYAINEYLPALPKKFNLFNKDGIKIVNPPVLQNGQPNPNAGKAVEGEPLLVNSLKKKIPHIHNTQNLEYYYEFLKQEQDKQNQQGQVQPQSGQGKPQAGQGQPQSGPMTMDDHSVWHESPLTEDEITDKVKEMVNKAVEQTGDRQMGRVHAGILQSITDLNHIPKDWRQDIQRFVARASEILIESSRKRRNRRYGILYAGNIVYPKLHLVNIIDASGSVNDEECTQFWAEMARIYKMNIKLTIIEHDTKVNAQYLFDPKKPFKLHGRGGTSFKDAYAAAAELDVDGIIHFTDGGCYDEGIKKPKVPVLWALTGGGQAPYKWGARTKIEVKKKVRR